MGVLSMVAESLAADYTISPFVSVLQEVNDNILLASDSEIEDDITTLSGGLSLLREEPLIEVGAKGDLEKVTYAETSVLNRYDYSAAVNLNHQLTQRFSYWADAAFANDSRPDRDLEITGIVLDAVNRDRLACSFSASYLMDEITTASVSYSYDREEYYDSEYSDVAANSASLTLTQNISGRVKGTSALVQVRYSDFGYDFSDVDSYSVSAGFQCSITDILDLEVTAGGRQTETHYSSMPSTYEEKDGIWAITLRYLKQDYSVFLSGSRDIRSASGRYGATHQTGVSGTVTWRLMSRLKVSLFAGYFLNTAKYTGKDAADLDRQTLRITPRFEWALTDTIGLKGCYSRTDYRNNSSDTNALRNQLMLTLRWEHDL
jgi:hypothetical protein